MMKTFLLLLALSLVSCSAFRSTRIPPPPNPIPARIPSGPLNPVPPPSKPLPEPPPLEKTAIVEPKPLPPPSVNLPPAPKRKAVARKKKVRPPKPLVEVYAAEPEPAPLLQLGEVLSTQQRTDLLRQTDSFLVTSDRLLTVAATRGLTRAQTDLVSRVRSLVLLAREARERSPAEARNLAERAGLFATRLLEDLDKAKSR